MCMDVVSELSYHEYVEAIQRDLTKTHSGDHRNDGTLRIYPVHMIWNETGRTVRHHPYRLLCLYRADGGFLWQQPLHDDDHDRSPQWEANSHLAQRRPQTPKATNANENTKTTNRPTNSRSAEAAACDQYRPKQRQTVADHTKAIQQLISAGDNCRSSSCGVHDNHSRSDYDQSCNR